MLRRSLALLAFSVTFLVQAVMAQTADSGAPGAVSATAVAGGSIAALPTVVAATTVALALVVGTNKSTSGTNGTVGSR
jgi:F0F1-type ATP synthase assembly protein I